MNPSQRGQKITDPEISSQTRHRDQGHRRVARLLLALGPETARKLWPGFSPAEAEALRTELTVIETLSPAQGRKVLEEFGCEHLPLNPGPLDGRVLVNLLQAGPGL